MKTKELIELMQKYDPSGDAEVVIPTYIGCGAPHAKVVNGGMGFDWYHGKFCLNTDKEVVHFYDYEEISDVYNYYNNVIYCMIGFRREKLIMSNNRKPRKVGRIIKARYIGKKDSWMEIKITKIIDMKLSYLPHPQYEAKIIENIF
jgi:hypothetical protein